MKITGITSQQKDKNRVNIFVDGKYRFSLDIFQLVDLGIKIGREYSDEELTELETESQFGKLYMRALDYCLMRPHSAKEVRDYLYRKTRDKRTKTGDIVKGIAPIITERVYNRLLEKNYINDEKFTYYWIENRNLKKGISQRKLVAELRTKGIDSTMAERLLAGSFRTDDDELKKIMSKKRSRYPDDQKFIAYLIRHGFRYDDIKNAMAVERIN